MPRAASWCYRPSRTRKPVTKIAYSKDGQFLYSIGEGKSLKKWDATKLVEKLVFPPQPDTMLSLAVRPDGKQVAVGRFDGVLQLLDANTGKVMSEPLPEKPKPPIVGKLTPNFGQRGQTTKVTLEGQHLDGELSIAASTPGVTIKVVGAVERRSGRLEIAVATNAAAGAGGAHVEERRRLGNAGQFHRRSLCRSRPTLAAIDSARHGNAVTLPATVAGTLDRAGQADYFRFHAKAGQGIGVQIFTTAVGSKLDPVLELTDADGRSLAESRQRPARLHVPGRRDYAIGVHDKDFRGGDGHVLPAECRRHSHRDQRAADGR